MTSTGAPGTGETPKAPTGAPVGATQPGTAGRWPVPGECVVCGCGPAAPLRVRKVTGVVLFWLSSRTSLPGACRACADATFSDNQSHCLALGWWGFIAPLVNVGVLIANAVAVSDHRSKVPAVLGRAPDVVAPRREPLPVRPLWRRPGPWVGVGVLAALLLLGPVVAVVAAVAGAVSGDGSIAAGSSGNSGDTPIDDLAVGDCLSDTGALEGTALLLSTLPVVDCSQPHVGQVFAVPEVSGTYPDDTALVDDDCAPPFQTFVGLPYADSEFVISAYTPSSADWDADGTNTVQCLLATSDGSTWTGTAQGAAR